MPSHSIEDPRVLTPDEAEVNEAVCLKNFKELEKNAPHLRKKHLQDRLDVARATCNEKAARAIIKMLKREASKKQWGIRRVKMSKPASQQVVAVEIRTEEDAIQRVSTEAEIIHHAGETLTSCYRMAYSAPMCDSTIFDDIGFLGDTAAAREILEGTYTFPPGTDKFTINLLQEASKIFTTTSLHKIATMVTMDDFQHWWRKADVNIQSSESGLHFDHYKAISYNNDLSALQVAKFNLAIVSGQPLLRWGNGVTVLLEKVFGEIFVEKRQGICYLRPISIG